VKARWIRGNSKFAKAESTLYNVKAAWGLCEVGLVLGEDRYVQAAVRNAVEKMRATLEGDDVKFLVQKFHPGGKEVILGAKAEEGLGHLIMFGIGGIYVEVLKDVVFKLTPVTKVEAQEMLTSIQAAPILKAVLGAPGVHKDGLIEVILRLSQLVTELPAIQELDLNPVIAFEDRLITVDARISISTV